MRRISALLGLAVTLVVACGDDAGPVSLSADAAPEVGPPDIPPPPPAEPGRHSVEVLETRRVVPSAGLPPETPPGAANNNLDVVRHDDGRVYLAFRTAPDHFASPEVRVHVVSSSDELTWQHEASFHRGTDLREPRLLSHGGTLFLYLSQLAPERGSFIPLGVARAEKPAGGDFGALAALDWGPYIVWRTRRERGTPYLVRYLGGEHLYRFDGLPVSVELLSSADGRAFAPVEPGRAEILRGGVSEVDFALDETGALFGVGRNEGGDAEGFGSKVCRAPADRLATWTCKSDPRRFDSPLVFAHDGEIYLVARRNLTATGAFDLQPGAPEPQKRGLPSYVDYIVRPKRCSLWRYVKAEDRIAFLADLPSRGDTCFPAWLPGATAETIVIYNYSSDLDGPDLGWADGQSRPTFIYRHLVRFSRTP